MRTLNIIMTCVFCISCNCNTNKLSEANRLQQEYDSGKYSLKSSDIQNAFVEEGLSFDCIENRYCRYLIPVEYTKGNCKAEFSRTGHLFPEGTKKFQLSKSAAKELAKKYPPKYCFTEKYGEWPSITVSANLQALPQDFYAWTFYKYVRGQLMKQKDYTDDRITEYLTSRYVKISDVSIEILDIESQHELLCSTEKSKYVSCINSRPEPTKKVSGYMLSGPFVGCHVYLFNINNKGYSDFEWTPQIQSLCKELNDKAQTVIENAGPFPEELLSQ